VIKVSSKIKSPLLSLITGFLLVLVVAELLSIRLDGPSTQWEIRRQKEQSAVSMHADDIWHNKRSTFQSFDPSSCANKFHSRWINSWHEVTCIAQDDMGQTWQYTARFGKRSSYLISWIPFIKDNRPARELIRIEGAFSFRSDSK
jgi:hypothetical protein